MVEHDAVDEEAVGVLARRVRRVAADEFATAVPGVVEAAEPVREAAPAVGEADPQRWRHGVEHPAEDHGQHRQMRLGRHPRQPAGHPAVVTRAGGHVPRVHEHRCANVGAVLEELHGAGVVEITLTDVVADLDPSVPGGQAAVELGAGGVGVLERNLAERDQPVAPGGDALQGEVVEDLGHLDRLAGRPLVAEEQRRRRHNLTVDAVVVHVDEPVGGIPACRADRSELGVADHDHRRPLGLQAQPRPAIAARDDGEVRPTAGNDVRVHVDDGGRHLGHLVRRPCQGAARRSWGTSGPPRSRRRR